MSVRQEIVNEAAHGDSWRTLTEDREKFDTFAEDADFTQGLRWARETLGADPAPVLRRHAFLLIQADCIARRATGHCVTFVEQHGFQPVHTVRVHLTPRTVGALWYYQSDNSTADDCIISELVCGRTDSLLLLLRDEAPEPGTPASLRLTRLKGPARPERRMPGHLRSEIGAQLPPVVLIHTSDEPADLIREAAIICGPSARELYSKMAAPVPDDAETRLMAHIEALNQETEAHDLDPEAAMVRLCDALRTAAADRDHAATARALLSTLTHVQAGSGFLDWEPFAADLRELGTDPTSWDPLLVGSRYIRKDKSEAPRRFAIVRPEPFDLAAPRTTG